MTRKPRVLVVDDDASVRKSLQKVLEGAGYEVASAENGPEANRSFESQRTDMVLLDLGLPIRDGWDAFESITSEAPVLPIIIITGQADQYDMAVAAGVGALMEKPLDVSQLLRTMEELLAEPCETRLRRLCGYAHDTRYVAADRAQVSGQLRARAAALPRSSPRLKLRQW